MNLMIKILFLITSFLLTSCAGLYENRSFRKEMERESDGFFAAGKDFEISDGDSGNPYRSMNEIRKRTPYSFKSDRRRRESRSLGRELASVRSKMTTEELNKYDNQKKYLPSVSERIYFLGLSGEEKEDYLSQRVPASDLEFRKRRVSNYREAKSIRDKALYLGMEKDVVEQSLGRPSQVSVAGDPRNQNEKWSYYEKDSRKNIYFEDGKVQGWEIR